MADRIKPEFIGKFFPPPPILSEEQKRALNQLRITRSGFPSGPKLSDEDAERLRKLLMKRRQNYKNGGAVMSGRGGKFKGVR